jgi:hypothetical protein
MSDYGISDFGSDLYDGIVTGGEKTIQFLSTNEWAANLVEGAANGASAYLLQEDAQEHERDLLRQKQRFEADQDKVEVGSINMNNYNSGLTNGALTNGLLAPKKPTQ